MSSDGPEDPIASMEAGVDGGGNDDNNDDDDDDDAGSTNLLANQSGEAGAV
jgi:hypothetical protein